MLNNSHPFYNILEEQCLKLLEQTNHLRVLPLQIQQTEQVIQTLKATFPTLAAFELCPVRCRLYHPELEPMGVKPILVYEKPGTQSPLLDSCKTGESLPTNRDFEQGNDQEKPLPPQLMPEAHQPEQLTDDSFPKVSSKESSITELIRKICREEFLAQRELELAANKEQILKSIDTQMKAFFAQMEKIELPGVFKNA